MSKKELIIIIILLIIGAGAFTICFVDNYNSISYKEESILTKDEIDNTLTELMKDEYKDGTYNLYTLEQITYDSGYQVSFYQVGDNYSDEEFNTLVERFLEESSDNVISAGKYEGETEISFNIEDKEVAIALAKEFNQISIWDWSLDNMVETGGTGNVNGNQISMARYTTQNLKILNLDFCTIKF